MLCFTVVFWWVCLCLFCLGKETLYMTYSYALPGSDHFWQALILSGRAGLGAVVLLINTIYNYTIYYAMLYLRSHEYLKHGTCASGIDCMDSEKGFFSTVLELHRTKMDFAAILASQGIYASHHHTFKVGCLQYTHTYVSLFTFRTMLK